MILKKKNIKKMYKGSLIHCHYSGFVKGKTLIKYLFHKKKIIFKNGQLIHTIKRNNNIKKNDILNYFNSIKGDFNKIGNLFYNIIKNISFFKDYHYLIIRQMKKQNIKNIEFRIRLGTHFNKNNKIPIEQELNLFVNIKELYKKYNRDFIIIVQYSKFSNKTYEYFNNILNIIEKNNKFKQIIKGFDIVGNENCKSLFEYENDVITLIERMNKFGFKFYFHAGEKNCQFTKSNLEFALKYGGDRIAHGVQILNYPSLLKIALEKKTILEICPLSNVILENYEPNMFINLRKSGLLFTISSDDPNKLGDKDLTDNFIYLFEKSNFSLDDLKKCVTLSDNVFKNKN